MHAMKKSDFEAPIKPKRSIMWIKNEQKNSIINTIRTSQTKAKWKFSKHLKTLKNWYIIIFLIKYFYLADLRDLKQNLKTFKTHKTGFTSYNFLICGPYNLPYMTLFCQPNIRKACTAGQWCSCTFFRTIKIKV